MVKRTLFEAGGHEIIAPLFDDDDFDLAVRTTQAASEQHQPDVIVGSSRGGAVALHSTIDDVISLANSEELVGNSGLPETFIEVGNDHRLADPLPLQSMLEACERLNTEVRT